MDATLAPTMGRPRKRTERMETTRILESLGAMIREMIARKRDYSVTDYVNDRLAPIVTSEYIEHRKNLPPLPSKAKNKSI